MQHNVLAMSGRAVEAAGDVNTLLLDKTGTITLGNRQAVEFLPAPGVTEVELAEAAQVSSLADEDAGRARHRASWEGALSGCGSARFADVKAAFTHSPRTRMSGVTIDGKRIMKGAARMQFQPGSRSRTAPRRPRWASWSKQVAHEGGTPLVVARDGRTLGVVYLKDSVKGGHAERFNQLRAMGIKTVMITGDNPITAAAIAREAGVDDFVAQADAGDQDEADQGGAEPGQAGGDDRDGTDNAPALAQADVGVAMNTGTMAAKEAGNMVDLDGDPTKMIEIVEIGKQLLMTRGALTMFSVVNDVAIYLAILPAIFATIWPELESLNVMRLHSPQSAILASLIFNALTILALIPLAFRGVLYKTTRRGRDAAAQSAYLRRGRDYRAVSGIWALDRLLCLLHLA